MARKCSLTRKGVLTGNNVSHAHNKTRRRFLPNLQVVSLFSEALGSPVKLRMSTKALRSVEHRGGIDAFLLDARDTELMPEAVSLKRRIRKAKEAKAA